MGSIFSPSHRFALEKPIRDVERTGKTLRGRDKAAQAKMERKVAAKRKKRKVKTIYIGTKAQRGKKKPKYDKYGDRIYRKGE
jgi:hypothetical protein